MGAIYTSRLVPVMQRAWQRWRRFAHRAAEVQSNVLLFLMFYLFVVPVSATFRMRRSRVSGAWLTLQQQEPGLDEVRSQF